MSDSASLPSYITVIVELVRLAQHWETQALDWERAANDSDERIGAFEREVERLSGQLDHALTRAREAEAKGDEVMRLAKDQHNVLKLNRDVTEAERNKRLAADQRIEVLEREKQHADTQCQIALTVLRSIGERIAADPSSPLLTQFNDFAGNAELVRDAARRVVDAWPDVLVWPTECRQAIPYEVARAMADLAKVVPPTNRGQPS